MYINNIKRIFTSLVVSAILLTAVGAKAQVKSYLGFYGGVSQPRGDFSSYSYDNNQSGFAKTGMTFGIDGAYYFYKNLGIGGSFAFFDQGELSATDVSTLATGYTASYGADQSTVTSNGSRYHSLSLLVGPQYSFTYGSFILDLRASAGYLKVSSTPGTEIELVGITDQTEPFYQRSASAYVFGYGGNARLRYKLSDGFFLTLGGNYINSKGPGIRNDDRQTDIGRIVTRQPITVLQGTLGLTFSF